MQPFWPSLFDGLPGLSFSVLPPTKPPGSLINIYKQLSQDIPGFKPPSSRWVDCRLHYDKVTSASQRSESCGWAWCSLVEHELDCSSPQARLPFQKGLGDIHCGGSAQDSGSTRSPWHCYHGVGPSCSEDVWCYRCGYGQFSFSFEDEWKLIDRPYCRRSISYWNRHILPLCRLTKVFLATSISARLMSG